MFFVFFFLWSVSSYLLVCSPQAVCKRNRFFLSVEFRDDVVFFCQSKCTVGRRLYDLISKFFIRQYSFSWNDRLRTHKTRECWAKILLFAKRNRAQWLIESFNMSYWTHLLVTFGFEKFRCGISIRFSYHRDCYARGPHTLFHICNQQREIRMCACRVA